MHELAPRDPNGCTAVVKAETLDIDGEVVVKGVGFNCDECILEAYKEVLGSEQQVDVGTVEFTTSVMQSGCKRLEKLASYSASIPSGFLPRIVES